MSRKELNGELSIACEPPKVRIPPKENIEKFAQVFLYILNKVGGKPKVGKTVLVKLLYFIDFDYYELYEEQLMGLEYKKRKHGPLPVNFNRLIADMKKENLLEEHKSKFFSKDQIKYVPRVEPDLSCLSAKEIKHVDSILEKHASKTATQISDFSHKDIPYIVARPGEILDYETVFYRSENTSIREYDDQGQQT